MSSARGRWTAIALIVALVLAVWGMLGFPHPGGTPAPDRPVATARPAAHRAIEAATMRWLDLRGDPGAWIVMANALAREGATADAIDALRSGIRQNPRSPDLRIALANALVLEAGQVTAPAAAAFDDADRLMPGSALPAYFRALALLETGGPEVSAAIAEAGRRAVPASPLAADIAGLAARVTAGPERR